MTRVAQTCNVMQLAAFAPETRSQRSHFVVQLTRVVLRSATTNRVLCLTMLPPR